MVRNNKETRWWQEQRLTVPEESQRRQALGSAAGPAEGRGACALRPHSEAARRSLPSHGCARQAPAASCHQSWRDAARDRTSEDPSSDAKDQHREL